MGNPKDSGISNNMAIIAELRAEIKQEILQEIKEDIPRKEFDNLANTNKELQDQLRDLREQNLRLDARTSNFNQNTSPYPSKKRSKTVSQLEKQFDELGVGVKPLRFIRHKYKGELLIKPDAIISREGEVIRMSYATNHESPFVDDHPDSPHWIVETEPIRFSTDGSSSAINVPPNNSCLQRYLIAHPGNGSQFYLEDKEQLARERNKREDAVIEALLQLEKFFNDEKFNERVFAVHALKTQQPLMDAIRLSREELKTELRSSLRSNPGLVESFNDHREECKYRYLYQKSLDEGLLIVTANEIRTAWSQERLVVIKSVADYDFAKTMKHKREMVDILKQKTNTIF